MNSQYKHRSGAFFPHTHQIQCHKVSQELESLGCFQYVSSENYRTHGLQNAFKQAGVSDTTIEALKCEFLNPSIQRKRLRILAVKHNLRITIRTEGDKDITRYGKEDGFPVPLALIEDHYIHLRQTEITSFAIKNYKELSHLTRWWEFKDLKKRDISRGMNTLQLLRQLLNTNLTNHIPS